MFVFDDALLKEALASSPIVKSVAELHPKYMAEPWAKERSVCRGYKLEIEINGVPVIFYFGIKNSFPLSLPYVFLAQWDLFGIIPHVEDDGYICYAQEEGSLLNSEDIEGLAQEALYRAVRVITDGISGKNHKDFLDEFGAYWDRLKKVKDVISIVSPGNQVKRIHLYKAHDRKRYFADDWHSFKKFLKLPPHDVWKYYSSIYIPLTPETIIIPPHPLKFWELPDIRKIIFDNLRADQKSELLSLIAKSHHEEFVLVSIPGMSGGKTLFGIKFKSVPYAHPLIDEGRASEIIPLSITRRDKEYLLPRGGSNLSLREKRVLLLGCGALGGFIANELAHAGILRLTVLDKDILTYENLFRHVLGRKYVRRNKVDGIKADIEEKLPYIEVTPICSSIEDAIRSGKIKVEDFDLIISALGNPTIELAFNKYVYANDSPPVIFTWLEPYGIGGHALLTRLKGSNGCLKCLYVNSEEGDIYCRASFAERGQVFAKNIDGCRNVFTPFGSLDAVKTAEIATRLAIGTLNSEVKTNLIRSWRGDAAEFQKNGKSLSSKYFYSNDNFIENIDYYYKGCPVCNVFEIEG